MMKHVLNLMFKSNLLMTELILFVNIYFLACPPLANCANTTCYDKHHVTCDRCVDKNLYKLAVGDTECLRKF